LAKLEYPPLTVDCVHEAVFNCPPPINEYAPLVVFLSPPTLAEQAPQAVLDLPPPTNEWLLEDTLP
jgi:hypothetical protein